jgi:hypothetical protein
MRSNSGAVVGGIIGGIACVSLLILLVCCFVRGRRRDDVDNSRTDWNVRARPYDTAPPAAQIHAKTYGETPRSLPADYAPTDGILMREQPNGYASGAAQSQYGDDGNALAQQYGGAAMSPGSEASAGRGYATGTEVLRRVGAGCTLSDCARWCDVKGVRVPCRSCRTYSAVRVDSARCACESAVSVDNDRQCDG